MNATERGHLPRALRMEWTRLATVRSTWLIALLALASSGGLGLAVAIDGRDDVNLDLAAAVLNPGQPAPTPVLLGLLGVLAWGHDYRYGTIRPLLAVIPRRGVLAGARVLVFTGFLAVLATAAVLLAALAGVLTTGGELSGYLDQAPIPRMIIGSVLFSVGCGWLGMALGALIRALPAAVAMLIAVPAVIEPLAALVVGQIDQGAELWLPFHVAGQMVNFQPPSGPSAATGALLFLAVMLAALAVGVVGFLRRDA
jgi:ABC-2 type transport system permease protein